MNSSSKIRNVVWLLLKANLKMTFLCMLFVVFFANSITNAQMASPATQLDKVDPKDAANIVTENGQQVVITNVAGTEYHIPLQYLHYPVESKHEDGLLLAAVLPDMAQIDSNIPDFGKSGWKNEVLILIGNAQSTTSVASRFGATKKIYGPMRANENKFGLNAYLGSNEQHVLGGGSHDPAIPKDQIYEEVFADGPSEAPATYINCDGDKAVINPSCAEVFSDNGILYQVTYGKAHLSEWKSIRSAAIDLLNRLSQKVPTPDVSHH